MKKLLTKIFLMMVCSMALVMAFSRLTLYILELFGVTNPTATYHISLLAGMLGLVLFALLLYLFVGRRLKTISNAVTSLSSGNLDEKITVKGNDELSQLARDFNRMVEGLKSNEYLNKQFARNVSHEFKTPLSVILGYSELMQDNKLSDEEVTEYAGYIRSEALRLTNLSEKLLEISKLDSQNLDIVKQEFYADEQIRNIILSLQLEWTRKNLNVEVDLPETLCYSNKDLCYMVWQNLISNAVKYTPDDGYITVKLENTDNHTVFTVTNSATNVKGKEDMIFQPFYTSGADGERGTGLGLPLVKKVLEKLGGNIEVFCDKDTTFTVKIPNKNKLNNK